MSFKELPERVVIDTSVETSLQDEYMVNSEGYLEVIIKYKNGGAPKVFIKAYHPTNVKCADLLLKKNSDLKKIIQAEEIECENLNVNALMRAAIWSNYSEDLQLQEIEIDASKEDAKKIWEKLASYLPVYSLFQSDRKNSDGDNEVQDPLKEAVKQILIDQSLQALNGNVRDEQKVLTEYIRHQIHHPENHLNTRYTRVELQQSIEEMRQFICDMEAEQLTEEP